MRSNIDFVVPRDCHLGPPSAGSDASNVSALPPTGRLRAMASALLFERDRPLGSRMAIATSQQASLGRASHERDGHKTAVPAQSGTNRVERRRLRRIGRRRPSTLSGGTTAEYGRWSARVSIALQGCPCRCSDAQRTRRASTRSAMRTPGVSLARERARARVRWEVCLRLPGAPTIGLSRFPIVGLLFLPHGAVTTRSGN